jgi:hypothetical protein
VTKRAKDKRWAIVPPPTSTAAAVSGEFSLEGEGIRRSPARHFQVEQPVVRPFSSGFLFPSEREIEDSERITEAPPFSGERSCASEEAFSDLAADTIPAPSWFEGE